MKSASRKENIYLSLLFNVLIPIFILSKATAFLGGYGALFVALSFPLAYGCYGYYKTKIINPLSVLGILSSFAKGIFAIFALSPQWFAVQEGALPFLFGIYIVFSHFTTNPLIYYFVYSDQIFNVENLNTALKEKGNEKAFSSLLWKMTLAFGGLLMVSGLVNYFLSLHIVTNIPGTSAFNSQLARMTILSYSVILVPKFVLMLSSIWLFIRKIKILTGLPVQSILRS